MPEFKAQRNSLNAKRTEHQSVSLNHFVSREKMKMLRREQSGLDRVKDPDNSDYLKQKAIIAQKIELLEEQIKAYRSRLDVIEAEIDELNIGFEALVDPRLQLPKYFANHTPFFLMPVRLETRFKLSLDPKFPNQPQLWVRVYPDTCMVDGFEPLLSLQEIQNTARFWAEYYAAGNIVDESNPNPLTLDRQKAAWALLVNLHGAGRAAWLAQSEEAKPQPGSVFPARNSDKTIILTIATEDESILADQAAIFQFFKDLWLAEGNELTKQAVIDSFPNAETIVAKFQPINFKDKLPENISTRTEADLQVALVLLLPAMENIGKTTSWSQASKVNILPERFILLGYRKGVEVLNQMGNMIPAALQVGFDPNAPEEDRFSPTESGDLYIPKGLQWIVDFDKAVEQGMGFKVDLDPDSAREGFDRLFVLGLRLSADETETGGQALVENLFEHHFYSSKGLQLIPQGTPTNNTDDGSAAYSPFENPDNTFDRYFKRNKAFTPTNNWQVKQDGQWITEWLGLKDELFQKVLNAEGTDQADALNMNLALWHGTLGYTMDALMQPVFNDETIDQTHQFFSFFVTGRGAAPAIRIANQPYGLLPTAAFNRLSWMYPFEDFDSLLGHSAFFKVNADNKEIKYISRLYETLLKIQEDWTIYFVPQVHHVSSESHNNTYESLLNILGLHPNSVEFHYRYLQTLEMLYSYATIQLPFDQVRMAFDKMEFGTPYELLKKLGYAEPEERLNAFPLLSTLYGLDNNWEHKVIIDSVPLSETNPIRGYTNDQKNYITALIRAANKSLDSLRNNTELKEIPSALLFSFLKFSLQQGYFDTSIRLHEAAQLLSSSEARKIRQEKPFVHMEWEGELVKSRYAYLYKQEPTIASGILIADHITGLLNNPESLLDISLGHAMQLLAMQQLENLPTAKLERAFVEHLDCCSYRLDAWMQGILRYQMTLMRNVIPLIKEQGDVNPVRKGLYVGAYGWLENVRPDFEKVLTTFDVPKDLKSDFTGTYVTDRANGGFLHAPSVNHAVTAAVLRNAFMVNGKSDNSSAFAVNLSSERVRLALWVIEGIQNGQNLGALLGYQFERYLHERKDLSNKGLDRYILHLRRLFPLNADQLKDTKVENDSSVDPDTVPISAIEARNVIHGKNLVDHIKKQSNSVNKRYPFGFDDKKLPVDNNDVIKAINSAADQILNIEDAISDLAIAESVHQVSMGNFDRAAGVLESYSSGNYPQTPDVIKTPRSGPVLTHRAGIPIQFIDSIPFNELHPRQCAEPSLDAWLDTIIPALSQIVCVCKYVDRTDDIPQEIAVSLQDLQLTALDLLYMAQTDGKAALNELDERFYQFIHTHKTPRLDVDIILSYTERTPDETQIPVFEILAFVKSLRALLLQSAYLRPNDIVLMSETDRMSSPLATLDKNRIDHVLNGLTTLLNTTYSTELSNPLNILPAEPDEIQAAAIVAAVDQLIDTAVKHFEKIGRYGLPQTGFGNWYLIRQGFILQLQDKIKEIKNRWIDKSLKYQALLDAYNPAALDATEQLQKMERVISTDYTPVDTINKAGLDTKKLAFDTKLKAIESLLEPDLLTGLADLIQRIEICSLNLSDFDLIPLEIQDIKGQVVRFVLNDLKPGINGLFSLVESRIAAAQVLLASFDTLNSEAKTKVIEAAAKQIFGESFRLIPKFTLPDLQRNELKNAWDSTDLLDYVTSGLNPPIEAPKEDWLHGIARVREKMRHIENCIFLREAFELDRSQLEIHPVQLPYRPEKYHWLAVPFPEEVSLEEGENLLYTAFVSNAMAAPDYACGFLIDEWTEVIPKEKETTGLVFNYDKPNSEAPQTMLMVLPTQLTGNWVWEDIVDALHSALDSAKLRAVEPELIDQTAYSRYLPSLITPVTYHPIVINMILNEAELSTQSGT